MRNNVTSIYRSNQKTVYLTIWILVSFQNNSQFFKTLSATKNQKKKNKKQKEEKPIFCD